MTPWPYLVPQHAGSPWSDLPTTGPAAALDWPTVGVYCPHEPTPWLLGSFRLSAEVLEHRGEAHWSWSRDYLTGDGLLIQLGRRSGDTGLHFLVGDEPTDRQVSRFVTDLRSRVTLRCSICGTSQAFRLERLQGVLATLYAAGIREITLDALARRVPNAAK